MLLGVTFVSYAVSIGRGLSFVYGKGAGLDTCFFTSYGLAQSTMCGSV